MLLQLRSAAKKCKPLKSELRDQKSVFESQAVEVNALLSGKPEVDAKLEELASAQCAFNEKMKGILSNANAISAAIENITAAVKDQAAKQHEATASLKKELASEVAPMLGEVRAKADAAAQAAEKGAARFERGLKQIKDNAASLWESLGQLACRLTEFEALADR